jgi:hypothetical protein
VQREAALSFLNILQKQTDDFVEESRDARESPWFLVHHGVDTEAMAPRQEMT